MSAEPIKYITKVKIQGLWERYDIEWNLHLDVNVLAGINGSGKTTILNFIYELLLTGVLPKKYTKSADTILLNLNDGGSIAYFNIDKHYPSCNELLAAEKESEGQINVYGLSRLTCSGYKSLKGSINVNAVRTFDTELKPLEAVQKLSDERVKTELDWEIDQLQRQYLNYQVDLGKKLKANRGNPDDTSTYFQDKFLEIIDELFSETNKKVNRDKNELEFLLGDKEINAYQLSSGEKQLLVILLTVLVQDNKPSILLMDEPEISLHIEWQRKLIKYIRELNPNTQIIIATHSPDIIVHGWLDNVFNLQDLIVKDNTVL